MKKQIIISLLFLILLAGIVIAIPAAETLFGVKIFNDGIKIGTDPNNAFLSNGNIMAKTIYSNGATVATLDANSKVPVANNYNSDTKNWVMNGNCAVAQRGTSWTNPVINTYTIDRTKVGGLSADGGSLPTIIHSQQNTTPGEILGSKNFYRINVDGAGSSFGNNSIYHISPCSIEQGTRYLCGLNKKVTLVFLARSSIPSKKLGIFLYQHYGTGGSPTSAELLAGTYYTLTSDWTIYSHTFSTNTLSGKTFGTNNDDRLNVFIAEMWGSANASVMGDTVAETFVGAGNIDIAQVALYAGDVAYPFEPVPYDIELLRCMRYCQVLKRLNLVRAGLYTTNNIYFYYKLSIPLRINNATLKFIGTANTDYGISTLSSVQQADFTFTTDSTFKDCISINATKNSHGLTDGIFYFFTSNGNIIIDADF